MFMQSVIAFDVSMGKSYMVIYNSAQICVYEGEILHNRLQLRNRISNFVIVQEKYNIFDIRSIKQTQKFINFFRSYRAIAWWPFKNNYDVVLIIFKRKFSGLTILYNMSIKLPFYSTYVRIRMAKNTLLRSEYVYYCKIFPYTQICFFLLLPLFYNESAHTTFHSVFHQLSLIVI